MRVCTSPAAVGGKIISSASESSAPFKVFAGGVCRDDFFFEPELLRAADRFGVLGEDFSRFAFGFCALGRLALAGFLAPRRACFLE
jgi:hypothetical protein